MGEIITIHVGGAGCRLGAVFWSSIAAEHGIGPDGLSSSAGASGAEVFFSVGAARRHQPRALFVGHSSVLAAISHSERGRAYHPELYLSYGAGTAHVDATGPIADDATLVDAAMDRIRRLTEVCASLEGFVFMHAVGGETASRLAPRLMERTAAAHPGSVITSLVVLPAADRIDRSSVTAPYRAVVSAAEVADRARLVIPVDNAASHEACRRAGAERPARDQLNQHVVDTFCALTARLRGAAGARVTLPAFVNELAPEPNRNFVALESCTPAGGAAPSGPAALGGVPRVLGHFDRTFAHRAYVHWLARDGLDGAALERARARLATLTEVYGA